MRERFKRLLLVLSVGIFCCGCGSAMNGAAAASANAGGTAADETAPATAGTNDEGIATTTTLEEAKKESAVSEDAAGSEQEPSADNMGRSFEEKEAAEECITECYSTNPYAMLLDFYYYGIQDNWQHYKEEEEDPETGLGYVSYMFTQPYTVVKGLSDAGYMLADINEDGQDELIVSPMGVASIGLIYDLYGIRGDSIYHEAFSGERFAYTLCEGGELVYYGSNGAASSLNSHCAITNEGLTILDEVNADFMLNAEEPWFAGSSEELSQEVLNSYDCNLLHSVSEDEAEEIMESWPEAVPLQLTSFADYKPYSEMPVYSLFVNLEPEDPFALTRQEVESVQALDDKTAERLKTEDLSQQEMNSLYQDIYEAWDNELNILWKRLKGILTPEEMAELTQEEREWIEGKEEAIRAAGSEYEDGSMRPMIETGKGAELTRSRVYELMERYLQ